MHNSLSSRGAIGWAREWIVDGVRPSVVLDFVNNRYYDGVRTSAAVGSFISGPVSISSAGLLLDAATIRAVGTMVSDLTGKEKTIAIEVSGGSSGTQTGLVSAGVHAPLFKLGSNQLRCYVDAVGLVNSSNSATWTGRVFGACGFDADAYLVLQQGEIATGASIPFVAPGIIELGSFSGGSLFGGRLRRLVVYPRRLSEKHLKSLNWPYPLRPFDGAAALKFREGEKLNAGAVLQYERTQARTVLCAINKYSKPSPPDTGVPGSSGAAIICANVAGVSGAFTGWELWINNYGYPHLRMFNNYGTGNWLGAYAAKDVCDGKWHTVGWTYDGSSAVSGCKIYVDGVSIALTTENDTLSATTVNANDFIIGNQTDFESGFYFDGVIDEFTVHDVERDASYMAAHAVQGAMPAAGDSNVVLRYAMDAGSGTSVADTSGSGFTGTITSANQWVLA